MKCEISWCDRLSIVKNLCSGHYNRLLKGMDLEKPFKKRTTKYMNIPCSANNCQDQAVSKKYCSFHYIRFKRGKDLDAPKQCDSGFPCKNEFCNRLSYCREFCRSCYVKLLKGIDPIEDLDPSIEKINNGPGWINNNGYVVLNRRGHWASGKRGYIMEHRLVMSEHLDRKLEQYETVHHKNGNRQDNDILNLELWCSRHPKGQRATDLLQWADFIYEKYGNEEKI